MTRKSGQATTQKRVRIGPVLLRNFRWFVAEMFYVYAQPEKS